MKICNISIVAEDSLFGKGGILDVQTSKFIHGILTLVMTGLIVRLLGFFIRLIMVRAVGEEAIGFYHLVLPTFFFVFTFTQLGLPVAIS